ncbi:MAG: L-seryl-tRNA(Sec) selenium transferase [Ktedonobacterales bacterium]
MSGQHNRTDTTRESASAGTDPATRGARGTRALPAVDALARASGAAEWAAARGIAGALVVRAARGVLEAARSETLAGGDVPGHDALVARVRAALERERQPSLRRVINATGVIVNTNLGRAPLGAAALAALVDAARDYSTLEYDLATGVRGSRQVHVRALLRALTGAEDALVVNNNAAAVLVALAALAAGREVIVSRGELVEIGGGFRVPDVMRQSGARLIEVGTTNRTRLADYAAAVTTETALLLVVHPSNFRIVGFTEAPDLAALAELAHAHGLPLVHDLGSGALLDTAAFGLAHEPMPQESIAAGADIVCFSTDKLVGGPQGGVLAGRADPLGRIARHPLMRAVRSDKLTLAALEVVLRQHRDGLAVHEIPVWQMIAEPEERLRARAHRLATALRALGLVVETPAGESTVGGGSLPGETLPTTLCAIAADSEQVPDVAALAARLRAGELPVVARVSRDRLLLDPRTVRPEDDETLLAALRQALPAPSS